jgi:aspartyl/asparaginyl beta-hydroxylase (cupin superfamily)
MYILILCIIVIVIGIIYIYYSHPYWVVEKWNAYLPYQTSPIFLKPEETNAISFHKDLLTNWDGLQKEILDQYSEGIPMKDVDDVQRNLMKEESGWSTLWLKIYNHSLPNELPILNSILKLHPEVVTCNISILKPGVIIPYHYGPFRGVWRYHLGIKVPNGNLGIKLTPPSFNENGKKYEIESESETYRWKEKEGIVFDDTLLHTAWNKTNETRVVVFADVLKPFKGIQNIINRGVVGLVKRTHHLSKVKNNIIAGKNISFK